MENQTCRDPNQISEKLVSVQPMISPEPSDWTSLKAEPVPEEPYKIMKIKEWLRNRKDIPSAVSRYGEKTINKNFYAPVTISGEKIGR